MAKRQDSERIEDIREAVKRIQSYAKGLTYDAFLKDIKKLAS